jgi:arginine repressor
MHEPCSEGFLNIIMIFSHLMCKQFNPELKNCPFCTDYLISKYNGKEKKVITRDGTLDCMEKVLKCKNKECKGHSMAFHSAEYRSLTLPGMSFGIDVVAFEADLRFEGHKTIEEIVSTLQDNGIHTTGATVSNHLDKFLALISAYQQEKIEKIRESFAKQGGYVLQIDGTVSTKTKTLYIFRDNISGTILYADLTTKDDTDSLKPHVQYILDTFGKPLAIVSDMQNSIIESVKAVFPGIPYQYCQYHFLKNVGNALLKDEHKKLGTEIRKKGAKKQIQDIQIEVEKRRSDDKRFEIIYLFCCALLGVTTRSVPFELYYLEIFSRYRIVRTALRKCIKKCDPGMEYLTYLKALDTILSSVVSDKSIKDSVTKLNYYNRFFKRLCNLFKEEKGTGKAVREKVEKRATRFLNEMKTRAKTDSEFNKIVTRLEK